MTQNGKKIYRGSSFGPKIGFSPLVNRLIAIRGSFTPLALYIPDLLIQTPVYSLILIMVRPSRTGTMQTSTRESFATMSLNSMIPRVCASDGGGV